MKALVHRGRTGTSVLDADASLFLEIVAGAV